MLLITVMACSLKADEKDTEIEDAVFMGTAEWFAVSDDGVRCDATILLTGTPYTGWFCESCEFVFEVNAEVVRDDGVADCFSNPHHPFESVYTLVPDGTRYVDPVVVGGYHDNHQGLFVLSLGNSEVYEDYYRMAHLVYRSYDYWSKGYASQTGDTLKWGLTSNARYYYAPLLDDVCWAPSNSQDTTPATGSSFAGSIPCEGRLVDVWTAEIDKPGARISIDATDAMLDPRMWLNDATGCSKVRADDNFQCSVDPAGTRFCPAVTVDDYRFLPGTHEVVVATRPNGCVGDRADYTLTLEGAASATLVHDDRPIYGSGFWGLSVIGELIPQPTE